LVLDDLGYGHIECVAASIGVAAPDIWATALQSQHAQFGSRFELLEFQQGWYVRACRKHTIDVLLPPSIGMAPIPQFSPPPMALGAFAPAEQQRACVAPPLQPGASEATLSRRARRGKARVGAAAALAAGPAAADGAGAGEVKHESEDDHLDPRASCAHPPRDPRVERVLDSGSGGEGSSDDSGSPHVGVVLAGHGSTVGGPSPAKVEEEAASKEEIGSL
jgi:hypothetical protein